MKKKGILAKPLAYLLLTAGAAIMLIPFIWMLSTSFKSLGEVFLYPPKLLGSKLVWQNYLRITERFPFGLFFLNSIKIAFLVVLGQLATSSLAAFAFARLRFRFRDLIFQIYLIFSMIPFFITLVPAFVLFKFLGLLDTHSSIILPVLVTPFGTFLLRQFFLTIPEDLASAAKMDGCNQFGVFWRIFIPLSRPALTTLCIFNLVSTWNDFFRPLVFLNGIRRLTLPLGLMAMQGMFATDWEVLMAAVTLSLLPVVIVFLSAQDVFIRGVTLSGMKS